MNNIIIGITGPESSGKTTIANYIYNKYGDVLVDEFAREYLIESKYTIEDLVEIAKKQYQLIDDANKNNKNKLIICDTEMTVIDIWAEDKFENKPKIIDELYKKQTIDIYILCSPDIKWEYDPLREDQFRRDELFNIYKNKLKKEKKLFFILKGDKLEREHFIDSKMSEIKKILKKL